MLPNGTGTWVLFPTKYQVLSPSIQTGILRGIPSWDVTTSALTELAVSHGFPIYSFVLGDGDFVGISEKLHSLRHQRLPSLFPTGPPRQ